LSPPVELSEIAVVICTYRSRQEVAEALRSCSASGLSESQITVVDNGSDDGTADLVGEQFPSVRLLRLKDNLGFAAANNLAASDIPGQALLLLNPDAVLVGAAVRAMLGALTADPRRGRSLPGLIAPTAASTPPAVAPSPAR
jgi:hypothetical protein